MKFDGQTFVSQTIVLDDNEFRNCTFTGCNVVFKASATTSLIGNVFKHCKWSFDGSAALTIQFLAALYADGGGSRDLVDRTLESIRRRRSKKTLSRAIRGPQRRR